MKLGEIKGKRQLKVMGRLMQLVYSVSDTEEFKAFIEDAKGGLDETVAIMSLGSLMQRDDVCDAVIDILAYAKGVEPEAVENPFAEIVEMLTSEEELAGFLSEQR